MCICATELKMCTYAGRVRASLTLDAGKRTRRPCYNVFTSFSQTTAVLYPLTCDTKVELSPCALEYFPDTQSRQLAVFGAPAASPIIESLAKPHLNFEIVWSDWFDCLRANLLWLSEGGWVKESFVWSKHTGGIQITIRYAPQIEHKTQRNPIQIYLIVMNARAHVRLTQECCGKNNCSWNNPVIIRTLIKKCIERHTLEVQYIFSDIIHEGTPVPLQYVPTWQGPHALALEDPEQRI